MPVPKMISASAAAMAAQLSQEQLRRRLARGEIRGQLVEGKYLVETESLAEWIREHRQPLPAA